MGAQCSWLTDQRGEKWEVANPWPNGYEIAFRGDLTVLIGPGGNEVASSGDLIGLNGTFDPPDLMSFCAVGRIFEAHEVVFIRRAETTPSP